MEPSLSLASRSRSRLRLTVVEEEGRDAVAVATEELRRAEEALEVARERGNRAQITRAENARDAASGHPEHDCTRSGTSAFAGFGRARSRFA